MAVQEAMARPGSLLESGRDVENQQLVKAHRGRVQDRLPIDELPFFVVRSPGHEIMELVDGHPRISP
jgi:hypothetical protein